MSRKIDIEVGLGGKVKFDFSGFPGQECFAEAEALQKALRELGLWAVPVSVIPKSSSQIEAELPERIENKQKVPVL